MSHPKIIDRAVENLEIDLLFKRADEAYVAIRQDKTLWAEEQEELALWDGALDDGLEDE